jgi:hypothetical protein
MRLRTALNSFPALIWWRSREMLADKEKPPNLRWIA